MPALRELQAAMRAGMLQGAPDAALACIDDAQFLPGQRLSIHRNTMLGALAHALRLSFPAVHRLVGAEFFDRAARVYACEQPPRSADLNAYGDEFADFLQHHAPAAALGYLPDVARLEWAVNRALHAPAVAALDVSALAGVAPCDHERVCFAWHPSVGLLASTYPVDAIWRAVLQQDEPAMAAIDLASGPVHLMVHRQAGAVEVERLDAPAWRFTSVLLAGQPLHAALAAAQRPDAAALLAAHLLAGRCIGFHLNPGETAP
jgi:hypothetical protein